MSFDKPQPNGSEQPKDRILFVDDEEPLLRSLRRILRNKRDVWQLFFESSVDSALDFLARQEVDAIVSDIQMPIRDGFDLLRTIREDSRLSEIPVVILTGNGERGLKNQALNLGASDLLNKPIEAEDLVARITSVLRLKKAQDQLRHQNTNLEALVRERTYALERSRLELIWRLSKAGEYRDNETGHHVVRVGHYCRALADALGLDPDFKEIVYLTAPLHDVGKIGIPDSILLKPGKLDPDEWTAMKRHTEIGAEILLMKSPVEQFAHTRPPSQVVTQTELRNPLVEFAADIALAHHERWDGKGYPKGLSEEQIPLAARLTAIADVYDALGSKRPYKPAFSEEKVLSIMREGRGTQFDPEVFEAFERSLNNFRDIRHQLCEPD